MVGVISAFNFPVAVWAWNTTLALVCGNAVIWKPSEKTPLTALATMAIAQRALARFGDAPEGLLELLVQKSANLPEAWKSLPVELKKGNQNDSALKKAVAGDGFLEKKDPADPFSPVKPWRRSLAKIRGMLLKLEGQFTSFWD